MRPTVDPNRRRRDAVVNALCQLERVRRFGAGQKNCELVATETRTRVAGADLTFGAPRNFLEGFVTGEMPEAVVDFLEVVDIDHQAGERLAGALGTRQLFAQAVVKVTPVVPAGQEVRDATAQQPRAIDRVFHADRD